MRTLPGLPCYHPLSCSACDRWGGPCGTHRAGEPGHDRCSGRLHRPECAWAGCDRKATVLQTRTRPCGHHLAAIAVCAGCATTITGPAPKPSVCDTCGETNHVIAGAGAGTG